MSHLIVATSSPMPCKGARGVQAQEVRYAFACEPALHLPLGFLDGGCGRAGEAVSPNGLTSPMILFYPSSPHLWESTSTLDGAIKASKSATLKSLAFQPHMATLAISVRPTTVDPTLRNSSFARHSRPQRKRVITLAECQSRQLCFVLGCLGRSSYARSGTERTTGLLRKVTRRARPASHTSTSLSCANGGKLRLACRYPFMPRIENTKKEK